MSSSPLPVGARKTDYHTPSPLGPALAVLGAVLLGLQLALCSQISFDEVRFSALCTAALGALLWPRRHTLNLASDGVSIGSGFALILFVLARLWVQPGVLFATVAPLFWGLGLALVASGIRGLYQYRREAIVLGAIVVTPLSETIALDLLGADLSPLTAQCSALLLRTLGWEAAARDVLVGVPTGWVLVSQGCSGLRTMYFLAGFAVIVLLLYPLPGILRKLGIIVGAASIGFLVNAVRVAMLVVLATPDHFRAFQFWHVKQGTMVIEVVAVVVFLAFFSAMIPDRGVRRPTTRSFR